MVTLVPETHTELSTEDGLNVAAKANDLVKPVMTLKNNDISVGVFIDAETEQVKAAKKIGADFVEFNTGKYATSCTLGSTEEVEREISALEDMTVLARKYGLKVKAGRGLNYRNVGAVAAIEGIDEIIVGHSIVSKAVMVGIDRAIRDMIDAIKG
jgi:pyridoxine 5-phosphate synthase